MQGHSGPVSRGADAALRASTVEVIENGSNGASSRKSCEVAQRRIIRMHSSDVFTDPGAGVAHLGFVAYSQGRSTGCARRMIEKGLD